MVRKQHSSSSVPAWNLGSARRPIPRMAVVFEQPLWAALVAGAVYLFFAIVRGPLWIATETAYYNYLADAFLHGQLYLREIPASTRDLSFFAGHYFLYWGPMPALVLIPFVALFGIQFSDTVFTLVVAALNVALVAMILRQACVRRVIKLSRGRRGLLVLCFALGTVLLPLAPFGHVWNTGQLLGFMFVGLCYLAALRLRGAPAFFLAGLSIAAAFLTRNHMVFAGIWPAYYLLAQHRGLDWRRLARNVSFGLLPVLVAVGLLGWYNWARFGSASDNGLAYHLMAPIFVDDYRQYGAFNLHYVPINVFYQYVAYPLPLQKNTFFGGSLFLLTPVFFAAFVGAVQMRPRWSMWALVGSIALVATPILLLMGTGWVQFGPRYTLDFTLPLLLLTAAGLRRWSMQSILLLTVISMAHYLLGTGYFLKAV